MDSIELDFIIEGIKEIADEYSRYGDDEAAEPYLRAISALRMREEMAMLIRQLCRACRDKPVAARAMEYLRKHDLQGSPLRKRAEAALVAERERAKYVQWPQLTTWDSQKDRKEDV